MTDRIMEEISIAKLSQEDDEGFVKDLLKLEMGLSNVQFDHLYQEYMTEDDILLINPEFWKLANTIDWQVVYMTKHLKHLLTFTYEERDGIMSYLQTHFQQPEVTRTIWLSDKAGLMDRGIEQVNAIIDSKLPFYREVNTVYVVNAIVRSELLEDKEAFLILQNWKNQLDTKKMKELRSLLGMPV